MKNKILMYHSIGISHNGEIGAGLYSVPVKNFEQQMELVHTTGTVPFGDCPCCIITFDDGDITNYRHAYPVLQLLGLKAYFFILAGRVGTEGYMRWEQIRELKNSGMIIGSHAMTHRILTELSDADLDYELRESKKILEDNLGCPIDFFSVPRGFYNKKVIKKAKEAGYKAVFTSKPSDNDGYRLGRIAVKGSWSLGYFKRALINGLSFNDRVIEKIKDSSKLLLGVKNYDRLRSLALKK